MGSVQPQGMIGVMTGATVVALRRWLLGILFLGLIGTGIELVLISHYEDAWQVAPLLLIATAVGALFWHEAGHGAARLSLFRWIMMLFVAAGLLGVGLHYQGAAEFQREMDPSQGQWSIFKKVMRVHAPPVLAPGLMMQLGLLGLAFSHGQAALTRRSDDGSVVL